MRKLKQLEGIDERILVIWETRNGNYVGEIYKGEYKRGQWSQRATFYEDDAQEYRVKEYFNFKEKSI